MDVNFLTSSREQEIICDQLFAHNPLFYGGFTMETQNSDFSTYHGVDARYRGPLPVAPTLSARAGTGLSEPREHDTELHDTDPHNTEPRDAEPHD